MVTRTTPSPQATPWRLGAQVVMARTAKDSPGRLAAARQDYQTARIAELIERELAKVSLRAEQLEAIRAIIGGADVSSALAGAVAAQPVTTAA